jgi:hypothetical protein
MRSSLSTGDRGVESPAEDPCLLSTAETSGEGSLPTARVCLETESGLRTKISRAWAASGDLTYGIYRVNGLR